MSSKISVAITWVLFAVASPLTACGETMTIAEYLSGKSEATKATDGAADENPFDDIGLELPGDASQAELFKEKGLQPYRIEAPDVISIEVASARDTSKSDLPAEINEAIGRRVVRPDGKISLGEFGELYIDGMTTDEASRAIQKKLGHALPEGKVAVDVYAANSKRYYIVMQDGGPVDEVKSCPASGNETVLDAIAQTDKAPRISKIWISRASDGVPREQILPVAWDEVRSGGSQATNYDLLPGDRVFVQIAEEQRATDVPATPVFAEGTPPVFLILQGSPVGDFAYAVECPPDATVGAALREASFPHPIDFKTTKIAVHRPQQHVNDDLTVEAEEEILRVEWDANTNEPTAKSNHRLQPSDRLIVTQTPSAVSAPLPPMPTPVAAYPVPNVSPQPIPVPPPVLAATPQPNAPEAPRTVVYSALPAPVASPFSPAEAMRATAQNFGGVTPAIVTEPVSDHRSTVRFDVAIVEDLGDNFAEFEQLRSQMPFMLTDTATIQGTLRILEKHKLVRRVSSPKLMVTAGETATLAIGNETPDADQPWQGIKAEMGARELGGGLAVNFSLAKTEGLHTNQVQTSLIVPHGQTVVMKTGSHLSQTSAEEVEASDKVEHAVYVVLTPEVVKTR